ncbi:ABC transporter permease subunit [Inquilinus limosus]|uniref:amino acid ABC transporter permease n=1 Tax=Inquilinus limosus TaxID=171674 RepID=UPI003F162C7B
MRKLHTLWYDGRVRAWTLQFALLAGIAGCLAWFALNAGANLASRGITMGFGFLGQSARFPIAEHVVDYSPADSYGWAYVVGLVNTIQIAVLVTLLATVLGTLIGLARRSRHPSLSGIATVFVEVHRNTPLVVQLLFWYALVTTGLPAVRQALQPLPGVFLSVRGLALPRLGLGDIGSWFWAAVLMAALGIVLGPRLGQAIGRGGLALRRSAWLLAGGLLVAAVWGLGGGRLSLDLPRLRGFNFTGGLSLTPEFVSLLVGLTLYSASFIGEIVRGGIDAVGRGQWEAGRSLGLSERRILALIVFPQALRIIVPPMGGQYLTIIKNITLALAVGYPDFASVAATTINQTGQAIEGVLILMTVYLTISLSISALINWFNRRVTLVS